MVDAIHTARLTLRPFRPADEAALQTLAGDRAIADTTISVPHPFTSEHAHAWIAEHGRADSSSLHRYFAVILRAEGALVGVVALRDIDREHAQAELSFWIGRAYWGRGLASEAAAAALRFGFEELDLNRVTAYHLVRNAASRRVLTRLGFQGEGLLRQRVKKMGRVRGRPGLCALAGGVSGGSGQHTGGATHPGWQWQLEWMSRVEGGRL
jgi:ribosomal-protein-alanine N-acetyltransferase